MKVFHLQPVAGHYDCLEDPALQGNIPPPTGATAMTTQELSRCLISDDERFVNGPPIDPDNRAAHLFLFDVSELPEPSLWLRFVALHEGYSVSGGGSIATSIKAYRPQDETWDWALSLCHHYNAYDTLIKGAHYDGQMWQGHDLSPPHYVDEEASLWLKAITTGELHTDFIELQVHVGAAISAAENLFGQRFRSFDDSVLIEEEEIQTISFERRDLPAGDWSLPTNPFPEGAHSPALECLPDGRLRAAYIDDEDLLQQRISPDDGETWEAA